MKNSNLPIIEVLQVLPGVDIFLTMEYLEGFAAPLWRSVDTGILYVSDRYAHCFHIDRSGNISVTADGVKLLLSYYYDSLLPRTVWAKKPAARTSVMRALNNLVASKSRVYPAEEIG